MAKSNIKTFKNIIWKQKFKRVIKKKHVKRNKNSDFE